MIGKLIGVCDQKISVDLRVVKSVAQAIGLLFNKTDAVAIEWPSKLDSAVSSPLVKIELLIWITKGLLWKGHFLGFSLLTELIDLLVRCSSPQMESSLGCIISDIRDIYCRETGVKIKVLTKQRVAYHCIQELSNSFKQITSPDAKISCLEVLSSLLKETPKTILREKFSDLMPMLLASLHFAADKPNYLVDNSLEMLQMVLENDSEVLTGHVNSVLEACLRLSDFRSGCSVVCIRFLFNHPQLQLKLCNSELEHLLVKWSVICRNCPIKRFSDSNP